MSEPRLSEALFREQIPVLGELMTHDAFHVIRWRVASLHFLLSVILLSVATLWCLLLAGYGWPIWYLQGSEHLLGVVAFVDLCLGPLITLIISNPKKPRRELIRDWAIIGVIQLAALGYGVFTLWEGRPVALVLSVDRVEVVTANMLGADKLPVAEARCSYDPPFTFLPKWHACWAVARSPEDSKKREELLFSSLSGGPDLSALPEYYVSLSGAQSDFQSALITAKECERKLPHLRKVIEAFLIKYSDHLDEIRLLWISGRDKSALLVIRSSDSTLQDVFLE